MASAVGAVVSRVLMMDGAEVPLAADLQEYGNEGGACGDHPSELVESAESPDVLVPSNPSRQNEMELAANEMQTVGLRCSDMPEASRETRLLRKTVSDGAKNIMSGLDSSASECQMQLLEILNAGERRQYDLVMTVAKGGHGCRELVRAVWNIRERIDQIVGLTGVKAGSNAKFDSKCIRPEMEGLRGVLMDFQQMEETLRGFCDREHREASMKAIQAASDQILSSDILGDIDGVWEEHQKHEEKQKELEVERGEKEGELKIKEAEKDWLKMKLARASEETNRIKEMLEKKEEDLKDLRQNKDCTAKDFLFRCQAAKEETKQQLKELEEKLQEDELESRGPLDECEQRIAGLQRQIMNLDHFNINHIIFAVDNSGSMRGASFYSAIKAVEAFRGTCVASGSLDKVSVVCFNSSAKCLVQAAPVTTKLDDKLKSEGCGGGTCFEKAWIEIQKCTEEEPKFARIFVVFLTDGLSSAEDVRDAGAVAKAIFTAAEDKKRMMNTCFVHVTDTNTHEIEEQVAKYLAPLVQAANGEQTAIEYMEDKIPLLQVVKSPDLVPAFEKLTMVVNMQKCILQLRMSNLRSQEKEYRTRHMENAKNLQLHFRDQSKRLQESSKQAEKSSRAGKHDMEGLYKALQQQIEADIKQLEKSVAAAEKSKVDLNKELAKCEAAFDGMKREFEVTQEAYEKKSKALQDMSKTHLSQLDRIHEKQKQLVDRFGSSNAKLLTLQLESLQKMKEQLGRNSIIEQAQIEEPLPATDRVSKAKVALKMISHQRNFEYKDVPQEDMKKLLEYEAKLQSRDDEEASKMMQTFIDAGISAEQICEAIDADGERVTEAKEELISSLHQQIFAQNDCDASEIEKTFKGKKKELQTKKEELKKLELEMKSSKRKANASRSNVSTSTSEEEENHGWEVVEDLEFKVGELKDEKVELEESVKTLESDLKSMKEAQRGLVKDLKPCSRVLDFAVDACRTAFFEHQAEEEKLALKAIFESFQNSVKGPMTSFAAMTEQARQVFMQDVTPVHQAALGDKPEILVVEDQKKN